MKIDTARAVLLRVAPSFLPRIMKRIRENVAKNSTFLKCYEKKIFTFIINHRAFISQIFNPEREKKREGRKENLGEQHILRFDPRPRACDILFKNRKHVRRR